MCTIGHANGERNATQPAGYNREIQSKGTKHRLEQEEGPHQTGIIFAPTGMKTNASKLGKVKKVPISDAARRQAVTSQATRQRRARREPAGCGGGKDKSLDHGHRLQHNANQGEQARSKAPQAVAPAHMGTRHTSIPQHQVRGDTGAKHPAPPEGRRPWLGRRASSAIMGPFARKGQIQQTLSPSQLVTQKWNEKQSAYSKDATARSRRGRGRCERNSLREHRARHAKRLEGVRQCIGGRTTKRTQTHETLGT